jgi:hypothetical protein
MSRLHTEKLSCIGIYKKIWNRAKIFFWCALSITPLPPPNPVSSCRNSFLFLWAIVSDLDLPNLRIWTCFPNSTEGGENHTETIAAEDIVIPGTPPLRSRLPCFVGHVVSPVEMSILYYAWEYIEYLDETQKKTGPWSRSGLAQPVKILDEKSN